MNDDSGPDQNEYKTARVPILADALRAVAPGQNKPEHAHFGFLFILLIAVLLTSEQGTDWWSRFLVRGLSITTVVVAAAVSGLWAKMGLIGRIILIVAGVVSVGFASNTGAASQSAAVFLAAGLYLAVSIGCVQRIVRISTVNMQALLGALCVYLFIGLFFAALYQGVDVISDKPVFSGTHPTDYGYASFITLTTVGFGDVVPQTVFVRRLVVVEAIFGQIFLATMVARLVSLFGSSKPTPPIK